MVGQVYGALLNIFTDHGKLSMEEAVNTLRIMEESGQLLVDCWGVLFRYEQTMEQLELKHNTMALQWLKRTFTKLKEGL